MVSEKEIERKLVSEVRRRGGIAPKCVSPSFDGMPDRLVFLPKGRFALVELKAPGEKPRALQLSRHRLLRRLGFTVYVVDNIQSAISAVRKINGEGPEEK